MPADPIDSAPDLAEWSVTIGLVRAPRGLDGEVRVKVLTDRAERFGALDEVAVFPVKGAGRLARVVGVGSDRSGVCLRFEGVTTIEAADALRGAELRIREDMRYPLEEGAYWVDDLVGLEIVTTTGVALGKIREVLQYPANDVYVTESCLVPALKDLIVSVDVEAGRMVVKPMPGLAPELGV